VEVTVDAAELLAGLDHPGRAPAQRHQSAAPVVMNVAGGLRVEAFLRVPWIFRRYPRG
jgi:hypothetical protein